MDFNLIMSNGCLTLKETIITSANLEHLIGVFYESVLFTTTRFSSVFSCEDLLISSFHRSANM